LNKKVFYITLMGDYQKALDFYNQIPNKNALTYTNIAMIYYAKKEYKKSLYYHKQSIKHITWITNPLEKRKNL